MRFLDQAIEEKLYAASDAALIVGTWNDFEKAVDNASAVFLFGTGEGADYVLCRYGDSIKFNAAVDNDSSKWGKKINSFTPYKLESDLAISPPDVIKDYSRSCVVLITSIRYCDEIYAQLNEMGVVHIFSLLHMEANKRIIEGTNADQTQDEKGEYAERCVNLPIVQNKVLLAQDVPGGHGKQIFKVLSRLNPKLDLIWVKESEDMEDIPGIRTVIQFNWKSYIEELETAYIWIFGDMIPEYAIKRPEQIYIHVKHWASITLKSFYFHLKQYLETKSIYDYYCHNTEAMDYCMVGSDFDEETCRSGFDFDGEFVRVGSPRSDVLFQEGVREKVYDHLGINEAIHTLLYAPTFRSKSSTSLIGCMREVDLDFEMLKEALENRFGGEWRILLRIHPDVAMESRKVIKPEYVIDVSYYPDSEELVAASDIMISDYSSIMFEPAFVMKPVFLYAPDVEEYITNDRELLLDYFSLPFSVSKSNDDLSQAISSFDQNKYEKEVETFLNYYGVREDGHASERAAKFIQGLIENTANYSTCD